TVNGSIARGWNHAAEAGSHHGRCDGDCVVSAGVPRRSALGADVLCADRGTDCGNIHHIAAGSRDLCDRRAGSESGEVERGKQLTGTTKGTRGTKDEINSTPCASCAFCGYGPLPQLELHADLSEMRARLLITKRVGQRL